MAEDPNKEQEQQENPGAAPESDGVPTLEELQLIKAELEEEKKAHAAADVAAGAALAERDSRIAELEASLSEAKQGSEAVTAELTHVKEAHSKAVARYLDVTKLANPTIPGDIIGGTTIQEIDDSLAKALSIAGAVKANLETEAKQAKVPAGAPPRGEISLEGLSPREKIVAGIQQGSQR